MEASLDAHPIPGTATVAPRAATREELLRVHLPEHLDLVARSAEYEQAFLTADTGTSARSYEAALRAAGAGIQAVEMVVEGRASGAFALVRPPGHHAEADHAMGFCSDRHGDQPALHADPPAEGTRRLGGVHLPPPG